MWLYRQFSFDYGIRFLYNGNECDCTDLIMSQMKFHLVHIQKEIVTTIIFTLMETKIHFSEGGQTGKTILPFPFKLNGIWSWWQFSCRFSEQNGILFGSIFWTKWNSIWFTKSEGKLSPRLYPIHFERKWKSSFLSAPTNWTGVNPNYQLSLKPLNPLNPSIR